MPKRTIVVVGAALGGPVAAQAARAADPNARILLLERADRPNPVACSLAQLVSGEAEPPSSARAVAAELKREHDVQLRTGQEVESLDPGRKRLTVGGKSLRYDSLVWATGAESVLPRIRGLALEGREPRPSNVARFRTLADHARIAAVRAEGGRSAVVLGGGYIGVEAADALRRAGFEVLLVEQGPQLLPDFSPEAAAAAKSALTASGVKVKLRTEVKRAKLSRGRVRALELARGGSLPLDLLVVAAGVRPRTDILREAGAKIDADGAVQVDAHAATSLPGVFACGVCAAVPDVVTGASRWSAQAAVADKTARVAGACAAGADRRLTGFAGSAVLRVGDSAIGRAGLSLAEAGAHAPGAVVEVEAEGPARDPSLTFSESIWVRLRCHRASGRLLGGEVVGRSGVDKRVDVLATALTGGLHVEALALLDLGFSPPFGTVADVLNLAAEAASAARAGA